MASTFLPPVSEIFVVIAKKAFKPLVNDSDQLPISNWGALRLTLQALLAEDASDFVRSEQLLAQAKRLLVTEEENLVGAGAAGSIQMDDSFEMECFPVGI